MKLCEKFDPLLIESIYGKINRQNLETLNDHLSLCLRCRKERDLLLAMMTSIREAFREEASPTLVEACRRRLLSLEPERLQPSLVAMIKARMLSTKLAWKITAAAAALVVLGLILIPFFRPERTFAQSIEAWEKVTYIHAKGQGSEPSGVVAIEYWFIRGEKMRFDAKSKANTSKFTSYYDDGTVFRMCSTTIKIPGLENKALFYIGPSEGLEKNQFAQMYSPDPFFKMLKTKAEKGEEEIEIKKLSEAPKINGVKMDVYEVRSWEGENVVVQRFWVSTRTGLFSKWTLQYQKSGQATELELYFDYPKRFDEKVFILETPKNAAVIDYFHIGFEDKPNILSPEKVGMIREENKISFYELPQGDGRSHEEKLADLVRDGYPSLIIERGEWTVDMGQGRTEKYAGIRVFFDAEPDGKPEAYTPRWGAGGIEEHCAMRRGRFYFLGPMPSQFDELPVVIVHRALTTRDVKVLYDVEPDGIMDAWAEMKNNP